MRMIEMQSKERERGGETYQNACRQEQNDTEMNTIREKC